MTALPRRERTGYEPLAGVRTDTARRHDDEPASASSFLRGHGHGPARHRRRGWLQSVRQLPAPDGPGPDAARVHQRDDDGTLDRRRRYDAPRMSLRARVGGAHGA